MTVSIQKIPPTDLVSSTDSFKELMRIVTQVNQLRPYALTAIEVAEWSKTLLSFPGLDFGGLQFLIDEMKFGRVEYDKGLGIQNLTVGLTRVEKTESGYRMKPYSWVG